MLVFSHIPKTAGTTLTSILIKNYGSKMISVIPEKGTTYSKTDFELDFDHNFVPYGISGQALKPFVDFGDHEDNFQWITFLRDPIERFVSQYLHEQVYSPFEYFMDIIPWGEKFDRSNWQVKWLAGEENLEKAKEIVHQKLSFIGVVEHFDESLQLLNQRLSTPIDISYDAPEMVALDKCLKRRLLNDESVREFVAEKNQLDIQLYNYVLDNIFYDQGIIGQEDHFRRGMSSFVMEKSRVYGFRYKNHFYRKAKKELSGQWERIGLEWRTRRCGHINTSSTG